MKIRDLKEGFGKFFNERNGFEFSALFERKKILKRGGRRNIQRNEMK